MESDILVDSNVYIDLMRAGKDPLRTLGEWAGTTDLVICGMVRLEVLRGIKPLKARTALAGFMDVMINIPSDARLWQEATDLAWRMDRQGLVIPGTDALIAASALRINAAVLTSDAHFKLVPGMRVIHPRPEWFR
jgi:predicted nucleic acid-binding protein